MSSKEIPRADYGVDAPAVVRNLAIAGAAGMLLAVALPIADRWAWPLGVAAGVLLATAGGMFLSSKVLKLHERDRIIDSIPWRGEERVLDVGCGRGLLLIGAARRLTTGRAVGVDIWESKDQSDNRPEATIANAKAEGVADRVELIDADAQRLPFDDASFDVVLSSFVIHNIHAAGGRGRAVREIARVLKPGGRVAILDIWATGTYARLLKEAGMPQVRRSAPRLPFFGAARLVTATKPS
jgi:SAM-dependent methyltransferase